MNANEKEMFRRVSPKYDTPMQEAYVHGYWKEIVSFFRNLFNTTLKTNPYFDRAILTGITRVNLLKLEAEGIPPERIRKYGFAFGGKKVLIG